jgi:hypothetical protein
MLTGLIMPIIPGSITPIRDNEFLLPPILLFFGCGKYPVAGALGFEVFIFDPAGSFLWMPSNRPLPQH